MIPERYKKVVAEKGKSQWLDRKSNVDSLIQSLKKHFPKIEGLRVLDAGCAQGRDSSEIASHGIKVEGIDYNEEFIKEAKLNCQDIPFFVGNIEKLPFKDGQFDAVYCVNTLFYISPEKALPELERVLKNNGLMFITLDREIINLDKNETIHSLDIEKALKLLKNSKVISREYKEREDNVPFKHKHFFYEIALIKNDN